MKTISTLQELALLRQEPAGSFALAADIDMAGESWLPPDFSGTLAGNGHFIRNLRVEKSEERQNAGFFGTLSGTVTDLHIRDAYICSNSCAYAGVLAGVIEGSAEGCTVTGQLCSCTGATIGAMAGKVTGTCIGGTSVTAKTGPHEEGGLCADVAMPENAALVGEKSETATVTGLWRDSTHILERCSKVLRQRREQVMAEMRAMATVQWQIDQDKLEHIKNRKICVHYQNYERGKVYQGIPYAHSGGSYLRFFGAMAGEKDGVYTAKPNLANGEYYIGATAEALASEGISLKDNYGFTQYMGNDCSSAVSWAWRKVTSADMTEGGCYGRYSGNMIPTEENKEKHGILPVGDFFACSEDTRLVLEQVGERAIYEAFARALPGDGLCGFDTSGHVLMLSCNSMVIRDASGSIEPDKSFLVTMEQGAGFYDTKGPDNRFREDLPEPRQTSWRVDYRYNFRNMALKGNYPDREQSRKYCGCDHVYLPITMQALQVEKTAAVEPRIWLEGSRVCSNFCIVYTAIEDREPVYTQISHDWHLYREFPVLSVELAQVHGLQPGTYTASVCLSNHQVERVTVTVA